MLFLGQNSMAAKTDKIDERHGKIRNAASEKVDGAGQLAEAGFE